MKRTTKKEALAQRAAWKLAVSEGRVVRFERAAEYGGNEQRFVSFPTIEARDAFLAKWPKDVPYNIVVAS